LTLPIDSGSTAPPVEVKASVAKEASPASRTDSPAQVTAAIRDLIVQLHQGNGRQAGVLMIEVSRLLESDTVAGSAHGGDRLQLTSAAIGEARTLLAEKDLWGAASAAREAAKEWRTNPVSD
jgi:hypothetical protein